MRSLRRIEPLPIAIAAVWLALLGVYARHLTTGWQPSRALFTLPILDWPVYWYGALIMLGALLGTWTAAQLAARRALATFMHTVPPAVRELPLASAGLPEPAVEQLRRRGYAAVGPVLYQWGSAPEPLGLSADLQAATRAALVARDDVSAAWLDDAPWRRWSPDHIWGALAWVLIFSVIGARLYHVLTPSPSMAALGIETPLDYFRHPVELFNLRNGGLGIYGALVGGVVALGLYARRHRLAWLDLTDLGAVASPLAQSIGRWGNFINQELYGGPTRLPWGVTLSDPPAPYDFGTRFQPAFLYEALWNLATFVILYRLARTGRLRRGELTALYLIAYSTGRILTELVRLDSRTVAGTSIPIASAVAAVTIAAAAIWLALGRRRLPVSTPPG